MLHRTFADGLRGEVDGLDRMTGAVFEEARTIDGFARVALDPEAGTVVWPGGADLAPETPYARVRTGAWPERPNALHTTAVRRLDEAGAARAGGPPAEGARRLSWTPGSLCAATGRAG